MTLYLQNSIIHYSWTICSEEIGYPTVILIYLYDIKSCIL